VAWHNSPKPASRQLHRSVDCYDDGPVWAVISDLVLTVSRKRTFAAAQKIGNVGSNQTFAAACTDVRFAEKLT